MQSIYNPIDYGFEWTDDGWYKFDRDAASKTALAIRNNKARDLRKRGYMVRCFTLKDQRITRGGIGSGKPQIDQIVSVYGLNYYN